MYRHLTLYRRSWPRLVDLAYWPILQMTIWGFTSRYFAQRVGSDVTVTVGVLLGGVLLWETALRSHLGFAATFLEEVWSRNLGHIFISPLRPWEMLAALVAMSIIRTACGILPATLLAGLLYHFNILSVGPVLGLFMLNLMVMGWWIALACTSLILSQGGGAAWHRSRRYITRSRSCRTGSSRSCSRCRRRTCSKACVRPSATA
jgi:ABC-2 type transport system permease protein